MSNERPFKKTENTSPLEDEHTRAVRAEQARIDAIVKQQSELAKRMEKGHKKAFGDEPAPWHNRADLQ